MLLLILEYVTLTLLGAKVLWNIAVAFTLAKRRRAGDKSGISLMPLVEISLLGLAVLLEWLVAPGDRLATPLFVGVIGLGAIVASYLAMPIVAAIFSSSRTPGGPPGQR